MNEEKMCPVITWRQQDGEGNPIRAICDRELCGLWDENRENCSMVSIAHSLDGLWDLLADVKELIGERT